MSLLNGAAAYFEFADFIPRMLLPVLPFSFLYLNFYLLQWELVLKETVLQDLVDPPSKFYPQLVTTQFTSPLDVGTER